MVEQQHESKKRRWPRRVLLALVVVFAVCGIGFGVYVSDYYHADKTAVAEAVGETQVVETDSYLAVGDASSEYGLVLYPGAKVEAEAYLSLAAELAEQGCYCVIAKMPFNLAFFNINAADALMATAPEIDSWWIGGHSLGGVAAAQYAAEHTGDFEGLVLLASYSPTNLFESGLAVESIYGSNDGVLNMESLESNASNLPANTQTFVIEGGNHAGFASYGPQDGDGEATITTESQQAQTAAHLLAAMQAAA